MKKELRRNQKPLLDSSSYSCIHPINRVTIHNSLLQGNEKKLFRKIAYPFLFNLKIDTHINSASIICPMPSTAFWNILSDQELYRILKTCPHLCSILVGLIEKSMAMWNFIHTNTLSFSTVQPGDNPLSDLYSYRHRGLHLPVSQVCGWLNRIQQDALWTPAEFVSQGVIRMLRSRQATTERSVGHHLPGKNKKSLLITFHYLETPNRIQADLAQASVIGSAIKTRTTIIITIFIIRIVSIQTS